MGPRSNDVVDPFGQTRAALLSVPGFFIEAQVLWLSPGIRFSRPFPPRLDKLMAIQENPLEFGTTHLTVLRSQVGSLHRRSAFI